MDILKRDYNESKIEKRTVKTVLFYCNVYDENIQWIFFIVDKTNIRSYNERKQNKCS